MADEADQPSGVAFRVGRLYLHHHGRSQRLLRFIAEEPGGEVLLFKEVHLTWNPVPTETVIVRKRKALGWLREGEIYEHPEAVRREFMNWSDEELLKKFQGSREGVDQLKNKAWIEQRDADYAAIETLVTRGSLATAYAPETQNALIRELTGGDAVRTQYLKRLLHRYAWFGLDANALLQLHSTKGTLGEAFMRQYSSKPGRPNSIVRLKPELKDKWGGRAITRADVTKFVIALQLFYVGKDFSYKEAYEEMVEHLYRQKTKTAEGVELSYPIARRKIPTYWAFAKRAPKLVRLLGLARFKEGRKDGKHLEERRGHDWDLVTNGCDLYDIDATEFNKEAIAQFKIDGEVLNIGRQTVVIVRARGSGKAMGWHCYTGFENWHQGYRLAVFCALTSKTRQLDWLGIDAPDAWRDDENVKPLAIFADNGAAASKQARAAYDRLDIDFLAASPDGPEQKGGEESLIGRMENAQSRDSGGYRRTSRDRDRAARRLAKLMACETSYEIEKKLVEDLIDENAEVNKEHLLTEEMRRKGVIGSANAIHSWWVKKLEGIESRRLSEAEVYRALLCHEDCEVTVNGIRRLKSLYNSDALRAHRRLHSGRISVRVMYHSLRPEEAAWITPDGTVDRLTREEGAERRWGRLSTTEIELLQILHQASKIIGEDKGTVGRKRGGVLSVRQADLLLDQAAAKPKRQRNRVTSDIDVVRKLQQALELEAKPIDKPELHAPEMGNSGASTLPGLDKLLKPEEPAEPAPATKRSTRTRPQGDPNPAAPAPVLPVAPAAARSPAPTPPPSPRPPTLGRVSSADMWLEEGED